MTLYELWLVILKRWKLIVIVPVVCAIACFGYIKLSGAGTIGTSYTAEARIVVNSQVPSVTGLASSEARQYIAQLYGEEIPENGAVEITAKGDNATMTVTVTAVGPKPDPCAEAANAVAEAAEQSAKETFSGFEETPFASRVELANAATKNDLGSSSRMTKLKYMLVAFLAGLFVAICIAVVLDLRKRSVKTADGAQEAVELPVLEILPAANGERLLANVRFASKKDELASVQVVPVNDAEAARATCDLLAQVGDDGARDLSVAQGVPLSESMQAAYDARKADAVVVTARQWADTLPQLESTVAELRLADVNLVGLVFAKDKLA